MRNNSNVISIIDAKRKEAYTHRIDSLIPLAVATANRAFPDIDVDKADITVRKEWDRIFHLTMDRLAKAKGYRRMSYQED